VAIYVVDGLPRSGKTAYMINKHIVGWLKDALKSGFKVFSNVFIHLENIRFIRDNYENPDDCVGDIYSDADLDDPCKLLYYWRNIDTWNAMRHGIIICDEATRYFNARAWPMLSQDTEIKLQQHGKDKLDVWTTTQHFSRLDVSLRVLVQSFFRVERVVGWGNTTYLSRISEHTLEDLVKYEANPLAFNKPVEEGEEEEGRRVDYDHFMPWAFWRKPLYDSEQPVGDTRPMPLKHFERFCPDPHCKLHNKPKISHA
jgi:hypothetical protein